MLQLLYTGWGEKEKESYVFLESILIEREWKEGRRLLWFGEGEESFLRDGGRNKLGKRKKRITCLNKDSRHYTC